MKWCSWIRKCIGLASFSVMINGVLVGYFGCSCGLRQGDPLSPLLFLLVVDVLGGMLDMAVGVGMLEGFSVGSGNVVVSHLQYADDTLIMWSNSQRQISL